MLTYPNIDPVIFDIYGPLKLRWYSLGYMIGIFFGAYFTSQELKKQSKISVSIFDDLISYLTFGIIIGGRIFYVLFYGDGYYLHNPIKALYLWDGGMSFHGGLSGVIVGMFLLAKKYKISPANVLDLGAISSTIGLFCVRIANFINGELYGRQSNIWCSFIFPADELQVSRHPSQLYEAFGEGLLLFMILFILYKKTNIYQAKWALSSLFLIGYGSVRFCIEFTREPDKQIGFILQYFTMGQVFCTIMIASGTLLCFYSYKNTVVKQK